MPDKPRSLRVDQVAEALNCSHSNVYELAQRSELEAFRIGFGQKRGGLRVLADSLEDFIKRRRAEFKNECAGIFPSTDSTEPAENSVLKQKRGRMGI